MTTKQIVREQMKLLLTGSVPLCLITFGAMCFAGFGGVRAAYSLLCGLLFSVVLFAFIGRSAAKAVLFPPAQGERIVRQGFAFRYALTAVYVILAFRLSWINPFGAVIPLFFPKVTFVLSSIFPRKGG